MKGSYSAMDGLLFAQAPPNQFNTAPPTNAPTITPVAPTFYMQGMVVAVLIAAAVGAVCWSSRR